MFITELFTIAKIWKQPKCPSVSKWVDKKQKQNQENVVLLHNGILHIRKKEGNPTFWNSTDGTGDDYAKGKKPVSERQIP